MAPRLPPPNKQSVFTPFLRRFTDERARDLKETIALYNEVRAAYLSSHWSKKDARDRVHNHIVDAVCKLPEMHRVMSIASAFDACQLALLGLEKTLFIFPDVDFNKPLSLQELVDLRRFLRAQQHFLAHEERGSETLVTTLVNALGGFVQCLPEIPNTDSPFIVPLLSVIPDLSAVVDALIGTFYKDEIDEAGLFVALKEQFYLNVCAASGLVPYQETKKRLITAADSTLPPEELVQTYLKGTPLLALLKASVPFDLGDARISHTHVVGGSGAGKSQLLQTLFLSDIKRGNPPGMIIIDSQRDLIDRLSHLDVFNPEGGELARKLIIIDPRDVSNPPALNIFDVNRERFSRYDEATREQVIAGVIDTFDYLFSAILGADLTAKQSVIFRFVARLMLALPETLGRTATILDLLHLMDDATPYRPAMASLPPIQRSFFEKDFGSKSFNQTKEQIRYRLNAILENPTLARLFTAPRNKIDIFEELNAGSVILVDTAQDFLKSASSYFGKIFISLALQAVHERAAIPEDERRTAYLIVDEAAEYFDQNIDDLLTTARKYRVGCLFAHQFMDQCTPALRASLAANTAIKLASTVSTSDARWLAPEMRTTTDFLLSQPKLHFACHVRGMTSAVSLEVSYGTLEAELRMSSAAYEKLRRENRARVGAPRSQAEKPVSDTPAGQGPPPEDVDTSASKEWG